MPSPNPPTAPPAHRLSLARIAQAASFVDPCFLDAPQREFTALSSRLGCRLTLKDETDNPIGCFKGRGAGHFVAHLVGHGAPPPLVCASAGNFGLAMAHACRRHGVELTVFVAESANPLKGQGIRERGARIVVAGHDFDQAKQAAQAFAQACGQRFVEDGAEPEISEGAGGIAAELLATGQCYDAVVVPLGNGALLAGMARWIKAHAPATEMIGVCSSGAPVMAECWRRDAVLPPRERVDTVADGIAVRCPVPSAVNDLRRLVDDVLLVDDPSLIAAMRALHADTGLVAEPSAAAGLAAIATNRQYFAGRHVATILTGRNLAPEHTAWLA